MIAGYHLIMTAYGFWLPNDPRGSWSHFVGSWDLFLAGGPVTRDKVTERRSYAKDPHDREMRLATKAALKYPPVRFTGIQARAIGRGFQQFVDKSGIRVWACAIMPDHVHLVIGGLRYPVEKASELLKASGVEETDRRRHPPAPRLCDRGWPPADLLRPRRVEGVPGS